MTKTEISNVQHRTLKAISDKPMTRRKIAEVAFNGNSVNFAPILGPLVKAKLIKPLEVDVDGATEVLFQATPAGKKVAKGPAPRMLKASGEHGPLPAVGGTLTKTYHGKEYTVKVTAEGFLYRGKTYSSLSATAKAIRGNDSEVNGWAFFGLNKSE